MNKEIIKEFRKKFVEVARSFSFKLNVGNFESRDFFCSQKAEVKEEQAEEISEKLYQFCKNGVMKSVNAYLKEIEEKKAEVKEKVLEGVTETKIQPF